MDSIAGAAINAEPFLRFPRALENSCFRHCFPISIWVLHWTPRVGWRPSHVFRPGQTVGASGTVSRRHALSGFEI